MNIYKACRSILFSLLVVSFFTSPSLAIPTDPNEYIDIDTSPAREKIMENYASIGMEEFPRFGSFKVNNDGFLTSVSGGRGFTAIKFHFTKKKLHSVEIIPDKHLPMFSQDDTFVTAVYQSASNIAKSIYQHRLYEEETKLPIRAREKRLRNVTALSHSFPGYNRSLINVITTETGRVEKITGDPHDPVITLKYVGASLASVDFGKSVNASAVYNVADEHILYQVSTLLEFAHNKLFCRGIRVP